MWHESYVHRVTELVMLDLRTCGLVAPPHSHDFMQVMMPARGILGMDVDDHGDRVDTHHAAFIPASTTHMFEATDANRFIVFDVPGQTVDTPSLDGPTNRMFSSLTPGLRVLVTWL